MLQTWGMETDDPIQTWAKGERYREVHRALHFLASPDRDEPAQDLLLPNVVDGLEELARRARDAAAASLGPTFRWTGPTGQDAPSWDAVILQCDLDSGEQDDPEDISDVGDWDQSALALAARVYRRECGWDHSPGEAGIWLLSVQPFQSVGTATQDWWSGVLTAFVILYDRDEDGEYETLGHVWTAEEWRRRGIATDLVRLARERFPVTRVDGTSNSGWLLLTNCAPDLLAGEPR